MLTKAEIAIDNAPGLKWRPRSDHMVATWVARADIAGKGFEPKSARLWPPTNDTQAALTEAVKTFLRSECQRLQIQMHAWNKTDEKTDGRLIWDGTIKGLIRCYEHDPRSPYKQLRHKTKRRYDARLAIVERGVGNTEVAAIKGRDFDDWYDRWAAPAKPGGRKRVSRAYEGIATLRLLMTYGAGTLDDDDANTECARLKSILSAKEFQDAKARTVELERHHAVAIIAKAHEMGRPSVALAQAMMWDMVLRQKDVIGEWVPLDEPGLSDVTYKGNKWLYGFDWREIGGDLVAKHRLSKSLKGRDAIMDPNVGNEKVFNLRLYPLVMAELERITGGNLNIPASGPIITNEQTGLPYTARRFLKAWTRVARAAGVPDGVQNRDTRAGAITETIDVAGIALAQKAAGHSQQATTEIYNRGETRRTAEAAVLRAEFAKKTGGER